MLNIPGGPMAGVLPTSVEDTDSVLVREDPTWDGATTEACVPCGLCSATGDATATRSLSTATKRSPLPHGWQLEKAHTQQQRPSIAKGRINK